MMRCDIMKMRSNADEHTDSNAKNTKEKTPCKKLSQMARNIRINMQGTCFVLQIAMIQTD
jgi:hypothetical protein